ncbi:hypothetical protein DSO57_1028117 [Entomophthora muscae]|uniref:Uncharacterized protein n=2 Tax=Entomophthora muscae TaxID=34485 RepID=A0ACC2UBC4_9FUNG|nr:hypothetical protein DSO57_1028117 [Entomophthora muscae]
MDHLVCQNDMSQQNSCIMKTVRVSPFVSKLYEILSAKENREIIRWDLDGIGFTIFSVPQFEEKIIKKHFKHKTITSFFRQLNLYDFERTSDGRKTRGKPGMGQCSFRHKFFTSCSPHNLSQVRRQLTKKGLKKLKIHPTLAFVPTENSSALPPKEYGQVIWQNSSSGAPSQVAAYCHPQKNISSYSHQPAHEPKAEPTRERIMQDVYPTQYTNWNNHAYVSHHPAFFMPHTNMYPVSFAQNAYTHSPHYPMPAINKPLPDSPGYLTQYTMGPTTEPPNYYRYPICQESIPFPTSDLPFSPVSQLSSPTLPYSSNHYNFKL